MAAAAWEGFACAAHVLEVAEAVVFPTDSKYDSIRPRDRHASRRNGSSTAML